MSPPIDGPLSISSGLELPEKRSARSSYEENKGRVLYSVEGYSEKLDLGPGRIVRGVQLDTNIAVDFVVAEDADWCMAYDPSSDTMAVGKRGIEARKKKNGIVAADIMSLHETEHYRYMHLSKEQQAALHNSVIEAVRTDAGRAAVLGEFARELYKDEKYLELHRVGNETATRSVLYEEGAGLKDTTTVRIRIGDTEEEVYLGLLLTEMYSYATAGEYTDVLKEATTEDKLSRERVKLAVRSRKELVDNNPPVRKVSVKNGLGLRRTRPDLDRVFSKPT